MLDRTSALDTMQRIFYRLPADVRTEMASDYNAIYDAIAEHVPEIDPNDVDSEFVNLDSREVTADVFDYIEKHRD